MKLRLFNFTIAVVILSSLNALLGIRFVIDRDECFFHNVKYEGDPIHVSFVVIKVNAAWKYTQNCVNLVVKGPAGDQIRDFHDKISEKFEFVARDRGLHRFCFTNKSPYNETTDFDLHVNHFSYYDQQERDVEQILELINLSEFKHLNPLLEQISKLDKALHSIQFEQHWLEAQTERQAIVNNAMSSRALHKAILESAALIAPSKFISFAASLNESLESQESNYHIAMTLDIGASTNFL